MMKRWAVSVRKCYGDQEERCCVVEAKDRRSAEVKGVKVLYGQSAGFWSDGSSELGRLGFGQVTRPVRGGNGSHNCLTGKVKLEALELPPVALCRECREMQPLAPDGTFERHCARHTSRDACPGSGQLALPETGPEGADRPTRPKVGK